MAGRLGVAAAAAAVFAAACGGASRSGVRVVGGELVVQPSAIDFGDVALGKEANTSVIVRNDGIGALNVESLAGVDPAFVISGLPVKLAPGGSSRVEVRYQPPALGAHQHILALLSDAPGETRADVDLRGRAVKGLAQLSGDVIDFGDVVLNEVSAQSFSLNNNDGHATTSVIIDRPQGSDAGAFSCAREGTLALGPEEQMTVRVEFVPRRLGDFVAQFQVTPCPTCSARPVVLAGRGVERLISVEPAAIDFGDVLLGSDASKPFAITNTSRANVTVLSMTLGAGAPDMSITLDNASLPYALAPGQKVTGAARFKPRGLGAQSSVANMPASDGGAGVLSLTGLGMGPVVQSRPKSLYVGATATGTTRTGSVIITNVGLDPRQIAPLSLTGISVVSNDPSWSATPSSASVGAPGSSVNVQVSFSPAQGGTSSATLVILSNDGLTPRLEVPLEALGRDLKPCTLSVQPSNPVNFGAVPLFHPSTQGFELLNTTADDCIIGDPVLSGGPAFRWPGGVTPAGRTLPSGGRMSVRVEFVPEAAQDYSGNVNFYLSNRSAPVLSVGLTGQGDTSCFFVTPGAVDFGGATQGCAAPDQNAYAVNQCGYTVTVTDVHTSGAPFFVGARPVPFTVQPQTSVPIPVSYKAANPGDDVGSLSVTASTRSSPYQVGLTAGSQPTTRVYDQWDQSTPKVDLLIVIDNSGSMAEEQHALAANLDHLWNRISLANADFHIAITTTGMTPYTQGWTQCPGGANGGEAGRFFPVDNSRPRLLTPSTPNVKDVLFANTNVGTCHWDERFLDPAIAALTDPLINSTKAPGTPWPNDGNAGFLRDDARLALLAVTDADDDADVPNPPPVSDYVKKLAALKHGALDLVSFAGLVPLRNCATAEQVGTRFLEIAAQLHGHLEDICDLNNFGTLLENSLGTLLQPLSSFPLSSRPRDPTAISVTVNGSGVTNWTYDPASNRIVFPAGSVPVPGSHVTAAYEAACK